MTIARDGTGPGRGSSGPAHSTPRLPDGMIGESEALLECAMRARELLEVAPSLLLEGEPGTGRAHLARALHHERSPAGAPCVAVDCASAHPAFLESDLTELLALVGRGTLLLRRVERLPPRLQARVIAWSDGDAARARVILTARPLLSTDEGAPEGLERPLQELLRSRSVSVPPLRKRGGDLDALADHFIEARAAALDLPPPTFTSGARAALHAHPWPGNVRELREVVETAVRRARSERIGAHQLRIRARVT